MERGNLRRSGICMLALLRSVLDKLHSQFIKENRKQELCNETCLLCEAC